MTDPTNDQLERAFQDGMRHHGRGIGTHTQSGQHFSPYLKEHPDLLAAWLAGYDRARNEAAA